jgi:hypothetical protein
MLRNEAISLLHKAKLAMIDTGHPRHAWDFEDIEVNLACNFYRTREIRRERARMILKKVCRAAPILSVMDRRVSVFCAAVLLAIED